MFHLCEKEIVNDFVYTHYNSRIQKILLTMVGSKKEGGRGYILFTIEHLLNCLNFHHGQTLSIQINK